MTAAAKAARPSTTDFVAAAMHKICYSVQRSPKSRHGCSPKYPLAEQANRGLVCIECELAGFRNAQGRRSHQVLALPLPCPSSRLEAPPPLTQTISISDDAALVASQWLAGAGIVVPQLVLRNRYSIQLAFFDGDRSAR